MGVSGGPALVQCPSVQNGLEAQNSPNNCPSYNGAPKIACFDGTGVPPIMCDCGCKTAQ